YRSSWQYRHQLPSCGRPSAVAPRVAARLYNRAPDETHSYAQRSLVRRLVPTRCAAPPAPPGRAPSVSPTAVAACCPAWESTCAAPLAADTPQSPAVRTHGSGLLPGGPQTSQSSRGLLPRPRDWLSLARRPPAGSVAHRLYQSD